jgi:hypothetical protein
MRPVQDRRDCPPDAYARDVIHGTEETQPRRSGSLDGSASRSALGGSGGEAGGQFRADVAVELIVAGLSDNRAGEYVSHSVRARCRNGAVPTGVYMEVDEPTDDIECTFDGARCLIQAKYSADRRVLKSVLTEQWIPTVQRADWSDGTALVLAAAELRDSLRILRAAWRRRQDPNAGAPSARERTALRCTMARRSDEDSLRRPPSLTKPLQIPLKGRC